MIILSIIGWGLIICIGGYLLWNIVERDFLLLLSSNTQSREEKNV